MFKAHLIKRIMMTINLVNIGSKLPLKLERNYEVLLNSFVLFPWR